MGLTGLDTTLERFYREGWAPGDPGLEAALVEALRDAGNYITPAMDDAYQAVMRGLYQKFFAANSPGSSAASQSQGGSLGKSRS